MKGIKVLPDELLENIRQYVGNCRIYNGEFIMTLDKKSENFMNIEHLIKKRLDNMSYNYTYTLGDQIEQTGCFVPQNIDSSLDRSIFMKNKGTYWHINSLWKQDKYDRRYRFIIYRYYAHTNKLVFHYKRKASNSTRLEAGFNVTYVIP